MRTRFQNRVQWIRGYLLYEALVYIGLVGLVLGTGFAVMYKCVDSTVALRRSAEDISAALRAGERWRADVRTSTGITQAATPDAGQVVKLTCPQGEVLYRFSNNAVTRQVQGASPFVLMANVAKSGMQSELRQKVTAWRWELELRPRSKGATKASKMRPLFTFFAVPERSSK